MTNLRTQMLLAMCFAHGPCNDSTCERACNNLSFAESDVGPVLDAALAAIEAAGWAVVPREATDDIRAAMKSAERIPQTVNEAWSNILNAAPKP